MHYTIDLRFGVPPLVNILLYLLLGSDHESTSSLIIRYFDDHFIWKITLLVLVFSLLLFVVSIKLPLTIIVFADPISFHFGDFRFSGILAVTLLAAFFFQPWLFWYTYLIFICISPWSDTIYERLQAIPTYFLHRQQEQPLDQILLQTDRVPLE